ncbi:MAG: hypothetical protein MI810_01645, partial [Flavobacteriales bacterium]|nr:hypothetical protein [Flavobacteriales bacterium]
NKGKQLVDLIGFHTITKLDEIKVLASTLFYIWKHIDKYQLYLSDITKQLGILLNLKGQSPKRTLSLNNTETAHLVRSQFLEKKTVPIKHRLELMILLYAEQSTTQFWGIEQDEFNSLVNYSYEILIEECENSGWEINDRDPLIFYSRLQKITDNEKLKKSLLQFLEGSEIKVFCAQILKPDPFYSHIYGISDLIKTLFGDHKKFESFLKGHEYSKNKAISEFLDFYGLLNIVGFNQDLKFVFEHLETINYVKEGIIATNANREEASENIMQIFFRLNFKLDHFRPKLDLGFETALKRFSSPNDLHYFVESKRTTPVNFQTKLFNELYEELSQFSPHVEMTLTNDLDNEKATILDVDNNEIIAELISFQYG